MITSPAANTSRPPRRRLATTVAIGVIVAATVLGLLVAGATFGALAIAFQIAVPIAQQYHVSVSADDMAAAQRIGAFWWIFGVGSIAAFLGAGAVALKAIRYLDTAS